MFYGENMKSKVIEVILLALILFMSAGILTSLKNDGDEQITEVVSEVQKKVKYVLEKTLDMKFKAINVFVNDIKNV